MKCGIVKHVYTLRKELPRQKAAFLFQERSLFSCLRLFSVPRRQLFHVALRRHIVKIDNIVKSALDERLADDRQSKEGKKKIHNCLLYTSPSPRDTR